jgi:hypothetical protein
MVVTTNCMPTAVTHIPDQVGISSISVRIAAANPPRFVVGIITAASTSSTHPATLEMHFTKGFPRQASQLLGVPANTVNTNILTACTAIPPTVSFPIDRIWK